MRLITLATALVVLLAAMLAYLLLVAAAPVHLAGLVPDDLYFAVTYRSINELREAFDKGYKPAERDFEPGRDLIGRRINVPDLDGLDFSRPAGGYVTSDGHEVLLAPVRDAAACRSAFERNRESVRVRPPSQVGDYLSFSTSTESASRRKDNPLVLRALEYPLGFVARPADGRSARLLLREVLRLDDARRLPDPVAALIAAECRDYVIGIRPRTPDGALALVDVTGTPPEEGLLARSAAVARRNNLADVARTLPAATLACAIFAVSARDNAALGLPDVVGDAAVAIAVVGPRPPLSLLIVVRPMGATGATTLPNGAFFAGPASLPAATMDIGTEVRTWPLAAAPSSCASVFATDQRQSLPLSVSAAHEGGFWLCAAGVNAETTVRTALACLRGARSASLEANLPCTAHKDFFLGGHLAMGMLSDAGAKALGGRLPVLEVAGIGPFATLTFTLDLDTLARLNLRLASS